MIKNSPNPNQREKKVTYIKELKTLLKNNPNITTKEAAKVLGVSVDSIRRYKKEGDLGTFDQTKEKAKRIQDLKTLVKNNPKITKKEAAKALDITVLSIRRYQKEKKNGLENLFLSDRHSNFLKPKEHIYQSSKKFKKQAQAIFFADRITTPICQICDRKEHMGQPIFEVLTIDHLSGDHRNNQINNLRLVCGNCHSLTTTFSKPRFQPIQGLPDKKTSNLYHTMDDLKKSVTKTERLKHQAGIGKVYSNLTLEQIWSGETAGQQVRAGRLLDRMIGERIIEPKCQFCKATTWNGLPIGVFLTLHHVNHNSNDNRLENLQALCSNCHLLKHRVSSTVQNFVSPNSQHNLDNPLVKSIKNALGSSPKKRNMTKLAKDLSISIGRLKSVIKANWPEFWVVDSGTPHAIDSNCPILLQRLEEALGSEPKKRNMSALARQFLLPRRQLRTIIQNRWPKFWLVTGVNQK